MLHKEWRVSRGKPTTIQLRLNPSGKRENFSFHHSKFQWNCSIRIPLDWLIFFPSVLCRSYRTSSLVFAPWREKWWKWRRDGNFGDVVETIHHIHLEFSIWESGNWWIKSGLAHTLLGLKNNLWKEETTSRVSTSFHPLILTEGTVEFKRHDFHLSCEPMHYSDCTDWIFRSPECCFREIGSGMDIHCMPWLKEWMSLCLFIITRNKEGHGWNRIRTNKDTRGWTDMKDMVIHSLRY